MSEYPGVDSIEPLGAGGMHTLTASNGRVYVIIPPTEAVPCWEAYRKTDGLMPQVEGIELQYALDEFFGREDA